jgi:hypothetical protein
MSTSRRSILTVLGLGAAGLVSGEAIASDENMHPAPPILRTGRDIQMNVATALENMAREIRAGNLAALEMDISTQLRPGDGHWLEHDIRIRVELIDEKPAA